MFEDALLESSVRRASARRQLHYLLAYVVESIIVGVLVLVPLIYTQALPRHLLILDLPSLPPSGRPPAPAAARPARTPHQPAVDPFHAPIRIPTTIAPIVEPLEPPQGPISPGPWVPGVPSGPGTGTGYFPGGVPWGKELPPPPPPVAHAAPQQTLVRLSKGVVAAKALYQPKPVYPQLAIMARIQGTVVLQAIIGKDGTVQDLKVLSGHPLLVRAAIDAVKTWRYQATLLNDEPVDVLTEIDVNFMLSE
jgi:protein TonB